ncbi:mitochondrial fission ELM1 family protein [Nitrincola sp.]|uniref:mitochondrial fission ELM1 family protein n=1 Tax=Nitrincola sp. TaxID=1926584 RepID=UPI003A959887
MSVVWIIRDAKPGHFSQCEGLSNALLELVPELKVETLDRLPAAQLLKILLTRNVPPEMASLRHRGAPDLLIAAGHATHFTLLVLGWVLGAKTLLLMKPSLPCQLFDLCLIPAHDQPAEADNIICTQGALNPMRPGLKKSGQGVILIGGPSKHHRWDEHSLMQQLGKIIQATDVHWTLTTSRRTPESTQNRLGALNTVEFIPFESTAPGWVAEQLASAEYVWVTEDSVSMIYEALTAGCAVGILNVPRAAAGKPNRLVRGLNTLVEQGQVSVYSNTDDLSLPRPAEVFNEAQRCAQMIIDRGWL